jgi:hypothetical protein
LRWAGCMNISGPNLHYIGGLASLASICHMEAVRHWPFASSSRVVVRILQWAIIPEIEVDPRDGEELLQL